MFPPEIPKFHFVLPEDKEKLSTSQVLPVQMKQKGCPRAVGCTGMQRTLVTSVRQIRVRIKRGLKLESHMQQNDAATPPFLDEARETSSVVIGWDKLYSHTWKCLFESVPADNTGLTQVRAEPSAVFRI